MGQATVTAAVESRRPARPDFDDLMRAHRRELLVHCYRMLDSWTDAEDCVQDVSLRAWRGLARFEGRASARSWLYRTATNACLTARRTRSRRSLPEAEGPPAASSSSAPSIEEETDEVADILGTSTTAVHSALARARARMHALRTADPGVARPDRRQRGILKRYLEAWERGDVKALVALFSRDAVVSMPPFAEWYRGRAAIARWLAERPLSGGRRFRLFPTRANGQVAFAFYKAGGPWEPPHESFTPHCIQLAWLQGDRITRVVSFLSHRLVRPTAAAARSSWASTAISTRRLRAARRRAPTTRSATG